jgi:large subunit ribosomal protein L24
MSRIKKNDRVMVITGKDKGKIGKVLRVYPENQRVLVEHINMLKKAVRKTQQNPQGGIIDREVPIHLSNVMLVDKKNNQPTRIRMEILKDGTKVRVAKKTGEHI